MPNIADFVHDLGGMAQKRQLVRRGARDRDLTLAVRDGSVVRARNGWYSTLPEEAPALRAVRVGGRLTGMSALIELGAWALGDFPLHVSVHDNAARLRNQWNRHSRINVNDPRGVVLHWDDRSVRDFGTSTSVGLLDALERAILDEPFETAVAVLDWALHTGVLDRFDFETLILRLPIERRGIADWVDATCESLPESLSRTRLRLAGWRVESQVRLGEVQRIDLVVEDVAAIEVDGDEHHRERFEQDRSKDIDITIDNLHALRPSARAVFYDWDRVARAISAALAARGVTLENSGGRRSHPRNARGISGWQRRRRRKIPEFPKRRREWRE
jgi:very-short-patch-repair endonuclease